MDWKRVNPKFEGGDGRLEVEARLRNLDGRQMEGEVELSMPVPGRETLRLKREVRMAGGTDQTLTMRLAFPGARRWEPWRLGDQPIYSAALVTRTAGAIESARIEDTFAFRELTWDIGARRSALSVNGRPMFLRGSCYPPSYRLYKLSPQRFHADPATAKSA